MHGMDNEICNGVIVGLQSPRRYEQHDNIEPQNGDKNMQNRYQEAARRA